jgi:hypothetical protein
MATLSPMTCPKKMRPATGNRPVQHLGQRDLGLQDRSLVAG